MQVFCYEDTANQRENAIIENLLEDYLKNVCGDLTSCDPNLIEYKAIPSDYWKAVEKDQIRIKKMIDELKEQIESSKNN